MERAAGSERKRSEKGSMQGGVLMKNKDFAIIYDDASSAVQHC